MEVEMMAFIISDLSPIPMPSLQCRGLQMTLEYSQIDSRRESQVKKVSCRIVKLHAIMSYRIIS